MKYTEPQVVAAVLTASRKHWPEFDSLPEEERKRRGGMTWFWLRHILDGLPNEPQVTDLTSDWSLVRSVATGFLVEAVKTQSTMTNEDEIVKILNQQALDEQSTIFMDLSLIALEAALKAGDLVSMLDRFDEIDLDLELQKLVARGV